MYGQLVLLYQPGLGVQSTRRLLAFTLVAQELWTAGRRMFSGSGQSWTGVMPELEPRERVM